jgi:SpoVK/Ycf46/Vps4 family AAA+-type ATPase
MFIKDKNNEFTIIPSDMKIDTYDRLDKGVYNVIVRPGDGPFDSPKITFAKMDDYKKGVKIDTGIFKEVRSFFNEFFNESLIEARKIMNMKNKLGVMFNGDPGTGKTFLAGQIAEELCELHDTIAFLVTEAADYSGLIDAVRKTDENRTIIIIVDEFEKTFKSYDTDTLSFLSGAKERDNVILIATVNDTNRLPSFIKDRPSRFEKIFEFSFKNEEVIKSIINTMTPLEYINKIDSKDLINKIKKHNNMSIDRIRHILRDVIAASIECEKTGIKKEVIIFNSKISRPVVAGFGQPDIPTPTEEIYSYSEEAEKEALLALQGVDFCEN